MIDEDLLIAIQNRHTESNAAVVNAVNALRQDLARHTEAVQRVSQWHPEDSGGVAGGSFDFGSSVAKIVGGDGWVDAARIGGDSPPGYKAVTLALNTGRWSATGTGLVPVGIVARIRYAVENQFQQEVIVDIPAGGLISVPICAGEVYVSLMLTQIAFTATEMQQGTGTPIGARAEGFGWPNFPQPTRLSFAASGYSTYAPVCNVGISALDSIGRTANTLPSRKVCVHVASGEGAFPMYIPQGTQAFIIQGPADGTVTQQDSITNFPGSRVNVPVAYNTTTQLIPGTQFIECSSGGGGYFSATFFLGT